MEEQQPTAETTPEKSTVLPPDVPQQQNVKKQPKKWLKASLIGIGAFVGAWIITASTLDHVTNFVDMVMFKQSTSSQPLTSADPSPRTVTTVKRQTYSIDVPRNFKDLQTEYRTSDMDIAKADGGEEQYVATIVEPAIDFGDDTTVESFAALAFRASQDVEGISYTSHDKITDRSVPNPHNYDVVDYRDTATVDGVKAVYYRRYVKAKDNYYQIITWTIPSHEAGNKQIFFDILSSMRIGHDVVDSV